MCAKNHLPIFGSFLDIWENVEWPRFFGPPGSWDVAISSSLGLLSKNVTPLSVRTHRKRQRRIWYRLANLEWLPWRNPQSVASCYCPVLHYGVLIPTCPAETPGQCDDNLQSFKLFDFVINYYSRYQNKTSYVNRYEFGLAWLIVKAVSREQKSAVGLAYKQK